MKNNILKDPRSQVLTPALCLVSIPGWQQGLTFSPVSGCEEPGLAVLPQVFNQPGKNTVRLPVLFSSPTPHAKSTLRVCMRPQSQTTHTHAHTTTIAAKRSPENPHLRVECVLPPELKPG